jgi:hypothetical protein
MRRFLPDNEEMLRSAEWDFEIISSNNPRLLWLRALRIYINKAACSLLPLGSYCNSPKWEVLMQKFNLVHTHRSFKL